jgi:hypothetical protein
VRNHSLRRACVLGLAAATSMLVLAAPAAPATRGLGISCPNPADQVFSPWKDASYYSLMPNGAFESGSTGWTLSGGAKVVPGSEPFNVHGARDAYSLSLPSGSSATTAPMCVSLLSGHLRLFVANQGAASSKLRVQVLYDGGVGSVLGLLGSTLGLADVGFLQSGSAWQPSQSVSMLGGTLPLLTGGVQFRFTPVDKSGKWQIDDVYVDPLMHG